MGTRADVANIFIDGRIDKHRAIAKPDTRNHAASIQGRLRSQGYPCYHEDVDYSNAFTSRFGLALVSTPESNGVVERSYELS